MWGTSYSINEWEDNHLQPERRVNIIVSPTTWGTHWKSYWILKNTKHMWETIKRNTAYSTHNNRFGVGEASAMELRSPIAHGKLGDLGLASGVSLKLGQMAHGWNKDHGSFQGRTERIEIMMNIADLTDGFCCTLSMHPVSLCLVRSCVRVDPVWLPLAIWPWPQAWPWKCWAWWCCWWSQRRW